MQSGFFNPTPTAFEQLQAASDQRLRSRIDSIVDNAVAQAEARARITAGAGFNIQAEDDGAGVWIHTAARSLGIQARAAQPSEDDVIRARETIAFARTGSQRFDSLIYGGGAIDLEGFINPVVIDIAGLQIRSKASPLLRDHEPGIIIGHIDKFMPGQQLLATGVISGTGADAVIFANSLANKFPWRASIRAAILKADFIPAGVTAQANGQTFAGPILMARQSRLAEVSAVAMGADDNTYFKLARR